MIETKTKNPSILTPRMLKCKLLDRIWLTATIIRMRIESYELANSSYPGQFVNIKVSDNYIPLLRRPFSIHRVNPKEGWFEILFQVIGKGTALLAVSPVGHDLDLFGPLGNSFSITNNSNQAVLIAGGLGIAPLLFLAQKLTQQQSSVILYYGNRSRSAFCCLEDFERLGVSYSLATEDGSHGFKGTVVDLIWSKRDVITNTTAMIYACGPIPMLLKIKQLSEQWNIPCQLSMETMMACGFGVCLGCVVNSSSAADPYKYVCKHGPVFFANEIELSE